MCRRDGETGRAGQCPERRIGPARPRRTPRWDRPLRRKRRDRCCVTLSPPVENRRRERTSALDCAIRPHRGPHVRSTASRLRATLSRLARDDGRSRPLHLSRLIVVDHRASSVSPLPVVLTVVSLLVEPTLHAFSADKEKGRRLPSARRPRPRKGDGGDTPGTLTDPSRRGPAAHRGKPYSFPPPWTRGAPDRSVREAARRGCALVGTSITTGADPQTNRGPGPACHAVPGRRVACARPRGPRA